MTMTMPMPEWALSVPSTPAIHNEPPPVAQWESLSDTALQGLRTQLVGALVRIISELPVIALNLVRQIISMIDNAEDVIFEIINMVLSWITAAPELIASVIDTVLTWITELPDLAISVINAIVGIITDIPTLISTVIDAIMDWITSIPDLIITVINTALSWVTDSGDLIETVINAGITWLTEIPELATSVIDAFLGFVKSIPDAATAILNAIVEWTTEIPDFITDLVGALLDWVRDVPALLLGVINTVVDWFTDDEDGLIAIIINAALGWITELPDLIATIITAGITWVTSIPEIAIDVIEAFLSIIGEIPGMISAVIEAALAWVTAVPEMATAIIEGFIAWLTDIPDLITTLITGVLDIITEVPTIITNLITTTLTWITDDGSGTLATSIIDSVLLWVTEIPDLINDVITSIMTLIGEAPELIGNVINSMLDWITDAPELIENLLNAVLGWVDSIPALAGAILDAIVTLITRAPEIAASIVSAMLTVIAAAPTLIFDLITAILAWLDDITGLNLASWAGQLLGIFGSGGGILDSFSGILGRFTNSILGRHNTSSGVPVLGSGQISNAPQNLLIDGIFGSGNAFNQVGNWVVDAATTVTGAIGSALATVVGGFQSLIGNALGVLPGETVKVNSSVRWDGLSTAAGLSGGLTASPLQASVNYYDGLGGLLGSVPLAGAGGSIGLSATPSSLGGLGFGMPVFGFSHETQEWRDQSENIVTGELMAHNFGYRAMPFGLDPDDDWVPIEGSIVVPDTIDGIVPASAAIMVNITDEVDSGQVWFTKAGLSKQQMIRQELIKNLPADKAAIINAAAGVTDATTGDIEARLAGLSAGSGNLDWTYAPDLRTLNDAVVTQLNNQVGTDFGHTDAATALLGQRLAALNANATVAALQADVAALAAMVAGNTNKSIYDGFQRTDTVDLGSDWDQFFLGSIGSPKFCINDGQNAQWDSTSSVVYKYGEIINLNNTTPTATDYQIITQVMSGGLSGASTYNYNALVGRANATCTDYIKFTYTGVVPSITWQLDYYISGTKYVVVSPTTINAYTGSMVMKCGDLATSNTDTVSIYSDNVLLWSGNVGSATVGASNRLMGFGSNVYSQLSGGTYYMITGNAVDSWAGRDA